MDVTFQVLKAVDYLHKRKIAHLAIRPENVNIMNNNDLSNVKLSEFGLAEKMTTSVMLKSIAETAYTAPELKRKRLMSLKSDIFSCGMLLCYTLLGYNPHEKWRINAFSSSSRWSIKELLTKAGISDDTRDLVA